MFHVALYQSEVLANTANIVRLCANVGSQLHLIHPQGDQQPLPDDLDKDDLACLSYHQSLRIFMARQKARSRLFVFSTKGKKPYCMANYHPGDCFLFGSETQGLPDNVLKVLPPESPRVYLPMLPDCRQLNLANAIAIVVYEAWRQQDFVGKAVLTE